MSVLCVDVIRPKYSGRVTVIPPVGGGGGPVDPNPIFETVTVTDLTSTSEILTTSGSLAIAPVDGVVYMNGTSIKFTEQNVLTTATFVVSGKTSFVPEINPGAWAFEYYGPYYPIIFDDGMCFSDSNQNGCNWDMPAPADSATGTFTIKFKMQPQIPGGLSTGDMELGIYDSVSSADCYLAYMGDGDLSYRFEFLGGLPIGAAINVFPSFAEFTTHEILWQYTQVGATFIVKICIDGVSVYRQTHAFPGANRRFLTDKLYAVHYTGSTIGQIKISDIEFHNVNLVTPTDDSGYIITPSVSVDRSSLPSFEIRSATDNTRALIRQEVGTGLDLSSGAGRITLSNPLYFDVLSSGNTAGLDVYGQANHFLPFTGAYVTGVDGQTAFLCSIVRLGKMVTMSWSPLNEAHAGNAEFQITSSTALTVNMQAELLQMCPAETMSAPIYLWHATKVLSNLQIDAAGICTINYKQDTVNWVAGQTMSMGGGQICWSLT